MNYRDLEQFKNTYFEKLDKFFEDYQKENYQASSYKSPTIFFPRLLQLRNAEPSLFILSRISAIIPARLKGTMK